MICIEINGTFIDSIPQKAKEEKKVQPEEEVLKEFYSSKENTGNILKEENDLMKAFEKTSLMILLELFEDNATIG